MYFLYCFAYNKTRSEVDIMREKVTTNRGFEQVNDSEVRTVIRSADTCRNRLGVSVSTKLNKKGSSLSIAIPEGIRRNVLVVLSGRQMAELYRVLKEHYRKVRRTRT